MIFKRIIIFFIIIAITFIINKITIVIANFLSKIKFIIAFIFYIFIIF